VLPEDIERIDIIAGGDHGKGAFVAGARIVVKLADNAKSAKGDDVQSFSFEISVAEIICRKDNAEILELTIKDELTKGLDTLATEPLHFFLDATNKIQCSVGTNNLAPANGDVCTHNANMYIVGDLAFYGMILGKESMSGTHCHLCKLPAAEFKNLLVNGEPWAWFTSIPLEHFVVPLLHCLIGVGNDIFAKFRDIVSETIEYIGQEEAQTRGARVAMEEKIIGLVAQRVMFDSSVSGKKLDSLIRTNSTRSWTSSRMKTTWLMMWTALERKVIMKMLLRWS